MGTALSCPSLTSKSKDRSVKLPSCVCLSGFKTNSRLKHSWIIFEHKCTKLEHMTIFSSYLNITWIERNIAMLLSGNNKLCCKTAQLKLVKLIGLSGKVDAARCESQNHAPSSGSQQWHTELSLTKEPSRLSILVRDTVWPYMPTAPNCPTPPNFHPTIIHWAIYSIYNH